jgi:hypothetical protein
MVLTKLLIIVTLCKTSAFLLTSSHVLTISGVHVIGLQILEADMLYRFNDHIAVNSVTGM